MDEARKPLGRQRMHDDHEAIRRVLGGDVQAFRILVLRYQAPLFRFIRNLVPTTGDCEDIAQEAFLAAFTHLGSYDPRRAAFSTWLFTIARNQCRNAIKKRNPVPMAAVPEQADPRTPEAVLSETETFRRFDAALAELPFEQRTAFALAEIEGLSYDEVARIEGVKLGTVKSRIARARQKLRHALRDVKE